MIDINLQALIRVGMFAVSNAGASLNRRAKGLYE